MIYADTNFYTNLLVDMPDSQEAQRLMPEATDILPMTWLLRLEIVNAFQRCVYLSHHGAQLLRVSPELASAVTGHFFEQMDLGIRFRRCQVSEQQVERVFMDLAHRHTAREGFRTYDILHVASALVLGCDTFWSFDAKAKKLARLEGLAVN
jgi:predicted nucleic acid-binding protein